MLTKKQFKEIKRNIELGKPITISWELSYNIRSWTSGHWFKWYNYKRTDEDDYYHDQNLRHRYFIRTAVKLGLIDRRTYDELPDRFFFSRLYMKYEALKFISVK